MRTVKDIVSAVTDVLGLDPAQARRRKAFLELGDRDGQLLRDLHARLGRGRLDFVDDFYDHLLAFDETHRLIADPATLQRLKRSQAAYFERLTAGDYGWSYVVDRLRVGVAHQRVGLEPQWYLGSYRKYLSWLLPAVWRLYPDDPERALDTFQALMKVVFLDMGLAIDTYIHVDREAVVATKAYAEKVLAAVPSGLLVLSEDLRVLLVNRSFRDAFDLRSADVVGHLVTDVLPVEGLREHALEVMSTGESRYALQFELGGPDGDPRPLRITIAGIRLTEEAEEARLLLVVEDLTEEERLRARARASEVRFREVVEQATEGIVMMGEDGRISYFNRAAEEMFGYRRDEVLGRPITLLMPAGYRERHEHVALQCPAVGDAVMPGKVRQVEGLRKDGTSFPIECTNSACRIDGYTVFTGMLRDIFERRRAEVALKRSEESFRTLIEQTPDAIAVHRRGRFLYVNPAMVRLLGYESAERLLDKHVPAIVHPDDREIAAERVRKMMATGEPAPHLEERFVREDGSTLHAEVVAMPLVFDGELAIVVVGRDITERKELTARMMQMDRMIAVGTMAAGIGHEINNPLTYVTANVAFALERLEGVQDFVDRLLHELRRGVGDPAFDAALARAAGPRGATGLADIREVLEDARDGGNRVRDIVRDLKTFSRGDDDVREALSLHRILESSISIVSNEVRHRARLVKDFGAVPAVHGNDSKLGQVFVNLLQNAAHAIDEGAAERNEIRVRTFVRDGRVAVEVRDTGTGILPENLSRLFDPFFTTKPVGQGTGLGLSICHQIIDAHGGDIEVESTPGQGSVFRVLLPPAPQEEDAEPEPARDEPAAAPGRRGRILVLDDEPMVGRIMVRTLRENHEVAPVTRARVALERLASGERFDLIFCDLMMPDMSGMDFYEELVEHYPAQAERVIFLTGGAFTPRAREFLDRVPNQHVDKPFNLRNLRALVRDMLRSPSAVSPGGSGASRG